MRAVEGLDLAVATNRPHVVAAHISAEVPNEDHRCRHVLDEQGAEKDLGALFVDDGEQGGSGPVDEEGPVEGRVLRRCPRECLG